MKLSVHMYDGVRVKDQDTDIRTDEVNAATRAGITTGRAAERWGSFGRGIGDEVPIAIAATLERMV